ncbi:hypothetical protein ACFY1V_13155 [Streptomyces sp. NPDC001255]|uniref:hypothetical protein n=1 Tax=Streptomyces sp. NPDC001255 TaxID=3364550 RepID=UPI00367C5DBF
MPEAPAEPFLALRHAVTGEITTTSYNLAARRILLQDGFEETPECCCEATQPATGRTQGPTLQPADCSSPPTRCTRTEPPGSR